MWLEEALNDLYEAGVQDDKLALIYLANEENHVAVKTPHGLTERKPIQRVVMQGGVFGPIKCSVQVDTIGKECIENEKHLYKYKDSVGIPPLGMVDDLIAVAECGTESLLLNSFINAKTNVKKLQFGIDKCHKIHIGANHQKCPELFIDKWEEIENVDSVEVHDVCKDVSKINETKQEKYLGDLICDNGKNAKNIAQRTGKGSGIVNQIMSILSDICFGKYQFQIALLLRNSLFLSSLMTNSEAWYNVLNKDLEELEAVDEDLLRKILETPLSTPKEMLYLELGCCPIRYIIKQRRIMFLQYILKQEESSLIYKVLEAQYEKPSRNDWISVVLADMEEIELDLPLGVVAEMSVEAFGKKVKEAVQSKAVEYLNSIKAKHSKVRTTKHEKLELQDYLKGSHVYSITESKFIFSLRTRMLEIKGNYENKHENKRCIACNNNDETQEHLLSCSKLWDSNRLIDTLPVYSDILGKYAEITSAFEARFILGRNEQCHPNTVAYLNHC